MDGVYQYKKDAIYKRISDAFGDRVEVEIESIDGAVKVQADDLLEVVAFCKEDEVTSCEMLHLISGVDYPDEEKLQVVYHLESVSDNHQVVLKVDVARDEPIVPSLVSFWPAADWMERETYDLVGVIFEGHPNLRRILCAEDWEGHPLRKDYVLPAYYHGIPNIFFEEQMTEEQKQLLYGDMPEEQRKLIYGE